MRWHDALDSATPREQILIGAIERIRDEFDNCDSDYTSKEEWNAVAGRILAQIADANYRYRLDSQVGR